MTQDPQAIADAIQNRQTDTQVDPASGAAPTAPKVPEADGRMAELARKEKAIAQKAREFAAKEAAQKAKEPELRTQFEAAFKDNLKARLSEDPLSFLAEYGITNEQLAEMLLNPRAPLPPEVKALREELNQIKESQTNAQKAQEEQRAQAFDKAVEQIRTDATSLIDGDERFETVKEMGAHEAVVQLIVETFNKTQKLMSQEEAAQKVEDYLLAESVRVANLKTVQARLKPQEPTPAPTQSAQTKTLTNRQETTPARGRLTEKQRLENAIAMGEGRPKPH